MDLATALSIYGGNSNDFVRQVHGAGKTALGRSLVYDSLIEEDLIPSVYEWERVMEIIDKAEAIADLSLGQQLDCNPSAGVRQ